MTPRASPSVSSDIRPAKQPRLSRSTLRVLSVWDQLAERYNKRLDEDDIVDLYSGTIISDRGVLKSAGKDYNIGHFAPDDSQDDEEQDQVDSEHDQDVDQDELDTLPTRDHSGTDGTMASTSELLRAVPPLSATTDADDLNEFLEVEKRRREILGDQDGEDDMSMEELAALREALGQSQEDEGQPEIVQEDESEDELSVWQHEASAVYHIARNESEQDVADGEQKINELTDSDEEFVKLLERPPRVEQRKRTYSSPSHLGISTGHTPVLNASPATSSTRFASRISSQDSPVPDTSLAHETILEQPPRVEKRKRISSSSSQRGISSGHTPAWSIVLNTPQTASSTRFVSRRSSQDIPVPDTPSAPSGTRSASRMSSKHTRVPDTPMAASSSRFASRISSEDIPVPDTPLAPSARFASRTPRTPLHSFHPVDPAQSPQNLLYQAMQQLSYALSVTMSSYGSPHVPPPPISPWSAYPPGFAHPWGSQGTTLDDDTTLVDDDSTPEVDNDGGVVENDRRRRRSTSPIGSENDTRKIECQMDIHSRRSRPSDQEGKQQGKRITARRQTSGSSFPEHGFKKSPSASKKKGNAKSKS